MGKQTDLESEPIRNMNMNIFRLLGGKTKILDLSCRIRFFCFDFCFFVFVLRVFLLVFFVVICGYYGGFRMKGDTM